MNKSLIDLFNQRVKDIANELKISEDEAFIKMIVITYKALEVNSYVMNLLKDHENNFKKEDGLDRTEI
jgi:hypothetical protein